MTDVADTRAFVPIGCKHFLRRQFELGLNIYLQLVFHFHAVNVRFKQLFTILTVLSSAKFASARASTDTFFTGRSFNFLIETRQTTLEDFLVPKDLPFKILLIDDDQRNSALVQRTLHASFSNLSIYVVKSEVQPLAYLNGS